MSVNTERIDSQIELLFGITGSGYTHAKPWKRHCVI